jgi:hypothetical protein
VTAVTTILLSQPVQARIASADKSETVPGALLLRLMLLLRVGMLMHVLHGERLAEFYTPGTARRDSSPLRGNDAHSDDGRHQSK